MKHFGMFLLGIILCAQLCAQNYSDNITLIQQDNNNVTVLVTGLGEKKKDATEHATKSAFNALFHSGIPELKNGVPMVALKRKDFDYRFFSEGRYINYLVGEVETIDSEKISGRYKVTARLTVNLKSLTAELQRNGLSLNPGWSDAKAVKATAALNPTIVIIPYITSKDGSGFEAMRKIVENSRTTRYAIDQLSGEFQRHGYKTRDFIGQLQNAKTSNILRMGSQTDDATMIVQQLPGDIIVTTEIDIRTDANRNSECTLTLRAEEKQTTGKLATSAFSSGKYMTTDSMKLADYAIKQIQGEFFDKLQASFEEMIKKGREVFIEINLSQAITDWDFEQDAPATGDYFKDALDDWLREHAFQGVYDMSNSTDKYINIRLNIPLWNMERNRSYTLSNFSSDVRKFFKAQLGDDYTASIVAMGQKLAITIE